MARAIDWRYLRCELTYRWKRTLLLVIGIALAATLVALLDSLARAFADVATVPFRNLGADLIVQRGTVDRAVPKAMGIMLPYSAQPIEPSEVKRLAASEGVVDSQAFLLLWNFGAGRFYSISGIPLQSQAKPLGPARVKEWLIKGRLPQPGSRELLVERHYGAFYRLDPGTTVDLGGEPFTVVGVVDIKEGSQIASSNFYLDIDQARALAGLPQDAVNQVFLKVTDMGAAEDIKQRIAAWMPRVSVASPGTLIQLFGGVSKAVARFGPVAVGVGLVVAVALCVVLVLGVANERRRELALLSVLGWEPGQVRRQLAAEMAIQGLLAGTVALLLIAAGLYAAAQIMVSLPATLPGEDPVSFASGGFRAAASSMQLPVTSRLWTWLAPPLVAAATCGIAGWLGARAISGRGLWQLLKAG